MDLASAARDNECVVVEEYPPAAAADPYVEPGATVHVTSGAAGCQEKTDPWRQPAFPFSAKRLDLYGFGVLTVESAERLRWEQLHAATAAQR